MSATGREFLLALEVLVEEQVARREAQRLEREGRKAQKAAEKVALKEAQKAEKARWELGSVVVSGSNKKRCWRPSLPAPSSFAAGLSSTLGSPKFFLSMYFY
jgi:hypothetical protein